MPVTVILGTKTMSAPRRDRVKPTRKGPEREDVMSLNFSKILLNLQNKTIKTKANKNPHQNGWHIAHLFTFWNLRDSQSENFFSQK